MSIQKKQGFFSLGIAFSRFSARPDIEREYEIVRKTALSVELEIPIYSEFKNQLFENPKEWFAGSNSEFRSYYRIGQLAFACFLVSISEEPKFELIDKSAQELKTLFSHERIPTKLLDDYLMSLKRGEPMEAFPEFVENFHTILPTISVLEDPI